MIAGKGGANPFAGALFVVSSILSPKRLYLMTLTIGGILVFITVTLFYIGNLMATKHAPLVDATMEMKLEVTTAHLWFEEIVSGDRNESMESVQAHLDKADWYINAILFGGVNEEGVFLPVEDYSVRQSIMSARESLADFQAIAEKRYHNIDLSSPGSIIDQEFDRVFKNFIDKADRAETILQQHITSEISYYQYLGFTLIGLSIALSFYIAGFVFKREKRLVELLQSVEDANVVIESKNLELSEIAFYDQLTGLPNRYIFNDRIGQAIAYAERNKSYFAVLFIDLDHFKAVNDQYGHINGDKLLQETSSRLRSCVRAGDSAIRISGDEFVIILGDMVDSNRALDSSTLVASKILDKLRTSFQIDDLVVHVTASIGIALYPEDGADSDSLLRHADSAMYYAKSLGKDNYQFYSEELNKKAMERLELEGELRNAIESGQLIVHYQPQWKLASGQFYGAEALVRWIHPSKGMIGPDIFIPVAEACGLIHKIDAFVFDEALAQLKDWQDRGVNIDHVSVNISPFYFRQKSFLSNVMESLDKARVDGSSVELEITESAFIDDLERAHQTLRNLNRMGIRIAIDDFGTGYSSLSYLRNLQFQTLKIDREFISNFEESKVATEILKSIIAMAKALGLAIVAEGIETTGQEEFLRSQGCLAGQGYLMSKPRPAGEFEQFVRSHSADNIHILKPSP